MPKDAIYFDSCVWISFYKPDTSTDALSFEQKIFVNSLFADAEKGKVFVVGSSFILTQVLDPSIDVLEMAFDGRKGLLIPADNEVCKRARTLQNDCRIKFKKALGSEDAIHLATASLWGCRRFVTKDKRRSNNQLSPLGDREELNKMLGLSILDPAELSAQPPLITDED